MIIEQIEKEMQMKKCQSKDFLCGVNFGWLGLAWFLSFPRSSVEAHAQTLLRLSLDDRAQFCSRRSR
jgi:hypothetical protein